MKLILSHLPWPRASHTVTAHQRTLCLGWTWYIRVFSVSQVLKQSYICGEVEMSPCWGEGQGDSEVGKHTLKSWVYLVLCTWLFFLTVEFLKLHVPDQVLVFSRKQVRILAQPDTPADARHCDCSEGVQKRAAGLGAELGWMRRSRPKSREEDGPSTSQIRRWRHKIN